MLGNEFKIDGFCPLDIVVDMLIKIKESGKSMKCTYNGHELLSDNVTIESAYNQVYGCSKEVYDAHEAEQERKLREYRETLQKQIPELYLKGQALMYPEKHEAWLERINEIITIHNGKDIALALNIMTVLAETQDMDSAVQMLLNEENEDNIHSYVLETMVYFANEGPEFFEAYVQSLGEEIDPEEKEIVENQKAQNKALKEKNSQKGNPGQK